MEVARDCFAGARHCGHCGGVAGTCATASSSRALRCDRATAKRPEGSKREERIEWICALCTELNIPALLAWSITEADLPGVVRKAAKVSSMQANPLPLMGEELMTVLAAARGR